jgi:hypothetical protein
MMYYKVVTAILNLREAVVVAPFDLLSTSPKCSFLSCNLTSYCSMCLFLKKAPSWLTEEQTN